MGSKHDWRSMISALFMQNTQGHYSWLCQSTIGLCERKGKEVHKDRRFIYHSNISHDVGVFSNFLMETKDFLGLKCSGHKELLLLQRKINF